MTTTPAEHHSPRFAGGGGVIPELRLPVRRTHRQPYSSRPEAIEPMLRYFIAASEATGLSRPRYQAVGAQRQHSSPSIHRDHARRPIHQHQPSRARAPARRIALEQVTAAGRAWRDED